MAPETEDQGQPDSQLPEKRFFIRSLTCVLIPPALAAYYGWTYFAWLQPSSKLEDDFDILALDGRLVWWSWFVIGAFALNISSYVLGGVEAGMLASEEFKHLNRFQLAFHKERTWSKCNGWYRAWKKCLSPLIATIWAKISRAEPVPVVPVLSWAWAILFGLSVMSWGFCPVWSDNGDKTGSQIWKHSWCSSHWCKCVEF